MRLSYRERSNATGNLEICFDNMWSAAADCSGVDQEVLEVACRALGFDDFDDLSLIPSTSSPVRSFTQPFFVGGLSCLGTETHLSQCEELLGKRRKRIDCPFATIGVQCLG